MLLHQQVGHTEPPQENRGHEPGGTAAAPNFVEKRYEPRRRLFFHWHDGGGNLNTLDGGSKGATQGFQAAHVEHYLRQLAFLEWPANGFSDLRGKLELIE